MVGMPTDASATRLVMLVGLVVKDDASYARYRAAMTPILTRMGGSFGYDFTVGQLLKSEVSASINRVFTINFPNRAVCESFFSDPDYRAARSEFFEPAVESTTIIAEFEQS